MNFDYFFSLFVKYKKYYNLFYIKQIIKKKIKEIIYIYFNACHILVAWRLLIQVNILIYFHQK